MGMASLTKETRLGRLAQGDYTDLLMSLTVRPQRLRQTHQCPELSSRFEMINCRKGSKMAVLERERERDDTDASLFPSHLYAGCAIQIRHGNCASLLVQHGGG